MSYLKNLLFLCLCIPLYTCARESQKGAAPIPAAELTTKYVSYLKDKKLALVVNQTSRIGQTHLVDSFIHLGLNVKCILAPEHGFRGDADAGELLENMVDTKTGIPLISLYGKRKKPTSDNLKDIDLVVFDIQDVGVRFYTYISTLHYVMEACAENKVELMILDRPNPNGFYVDGPVLDPKFRSFVGMHPVPVVHGMTIAEYALMINGENWLTNSLQCKLYIVKNEAYTHSKLYTLPIKPSPNLPNMQSVYLYPSLCFFEGTVVSMGRGTYAPFQIIGHPLFRNIYDYTFSPQGIIGMSKNPPYEGQLCFGLNLQGYVMDTAITEGKIILKWLIEFYQKYPNRNQFFNPFFDKLAGNFELRQQLIAGKTEEEIRKSWEPELEKYKKMRKKYLLYKE